jgi:hypothetical protein
MPNLFLRLEPHQLAVVTRHAASALPRWATSSAFSSLTRTPDELSIVCDWDAVPEEIPKVGPWQAFVVAGPLDFELVGVMATLAGTLAEAGIPLLAISTHDTDWILVREERVADARSVFEAAGIQVTDTRHTSSGCT